MSIYGKCDRKSTVPMLLQGLSITTAGRRGNRILRLATGLMLACLVTAAAQPHASDVLNRHDRAAGVTISVLQSGLGVPFAVLARAELVATKIFASIDVPVEWRSGVERRSSGEADVTIEMQFDFGVPAAFHPGALAYATPYGTGGTLIHVFCDRVLNVSSRELAGPYLGHVIAHEITHVLEGISRHSSEGVMKAHWSVHDFYEMPFRPLRFAPEDVELIHSGLERRKQAH